MFDALLELSEHEAPADTFRSVRLAVAGAAELPVTTAGAFLDRFGVTISRGLRAHGGGTDRVDDRDGPPTALGIDRSAATGRRRAAGRRATAVTPPSVTPARSGSADRTSSSGYWDDPEATARVLVDGWLRTGDVAVSDDDGFLSLVDRMKDLVIVSGFNVYPAEVEEVLRTHPDVVDAAVIGIPSPRTGEAVAAVLVPRPGAVPSLASVRDHVARRLARYKVPTTVQMVDALPRNQSGKVVRRALSIPVED